MTSGTTIAAIYLCQSIPTYELDLKKLERILFKKKKRYA